MPRRSWPPVRSAVSSRRGRTRCAWSSAVSCTAPEVEPYDLVLRAGRAVLPTGVTAVCVGVSGGKVRTVRAYDDVPLARRVVELADDEVLIPGLVDTHVHLQNPGHPEWEDVTAATRGALLGGVTTLVDMPVDCEPPTVDPPALQAKCEALGGRVFTDVGFWGGVVPSR